MRVSRADVAPYSLRLRHPYETAVGTVDRRHGFLLRIATDAGQIGWGDAAPLEGYTPDLPGPVSDRLQAIAANAGGMLVDDVVASVADLAETLPTVVAAVEAAAATARAEAGAVALATQLTPGVPLSSLPVHALVTGASPSNVAAAGRAAVAAGYPACKLKVGARPEEEDIERIRALREAIGPTMRLRLDANRAWALDEALRVLETATTLGIEYVEDPVAGWDEMAELRQRVDVPLAVDQLFRSGEGIPAARVVAAVAVVKPSASGGPVRSLELAAAAESAGLRVVFGSLLESAVGLTAGIHTAAAWSRPEAVSGLSTGQMFVADVARTPPVAKGAVAVPSGPGLGIAVTESVAEDTSPQLSEGGPG